MDKISIKKYAKQIEKAINLFWDTRHKQNKGRKKLDQGNRSSVTGGKHLDGFVELLVQVAIDAGIPMKCIFTKGNVLPGYFRPTKDWDFLIISPNKKLIAIIEFKSQVGSFGNNFNNRTEEALGNAVDLWTAFREKVFPQTQPPWVGYLILVEKNDKSTKEIRIQEPHYPVRAEFLHSSYLDRYKILCEKLMLEKHYNSAAIIWSNTDKEFGSINKDLSIEAFLYSFIGFLHGKINDFQ